MNAPPAAAGAGAPAPKPVAAPIGLKYVCGGCGILNSLSPRDQVRCRACGYRIFYKVRTERLTQFEAR